jgi:glycine/sarcosine N-methyltransferase
VSTVPADDFYDALAPLFDVMTDWQARLATEGPFLQAVLSEAGAQRVLDAACGSGGHAFALHEWGYSVTGADISAGMIEIARTKAAQAQVPVPFVVSDLAGLPQHLPPEHAFDAVLCLGNSLPHLLTQDALIAALRGMAGVLRPGGLLVLHNLNYDLRWKSRPRFFAAQGGSLAGEEVLVWRFADYDLPPGQIAFNIAMFRKPQTGAQGNWSVQVHTTTQRPLFEADLQAALEAAKFERVRMYGSMRWPLEPFELQRSGDLVAVAELG